MSRLSRKISLFISLTLFLFCLNPLSAFAQEANDDVTHVVQYGDTLFRIALRYGVSMSDIIAANDIVDPSRINVGKTLIIPGLSQPVGTDVENPLVAAAPVVHIVARGENLTAIAQKYGTTVNQILKANNIANMNRIIPGQSLQIWPSSLSNTAVPATETEPTTLTDPFTTTTTTDNVILSTPIPVPTPEPIRHVVLRGEYLSQIARNYGVSWTSIAEANNILDPNNIYAGLELIIPNTIAPTEQFGILDRTTALATVGEPGPRWGVGKELVVILSTQMAYAYEDGQLIYSSLISSGLPATPTVQGDYKIYLKRDSQTMSGPGYYLPGVQWVMYFYSGYGFHGTYWHDNFGSPMSHGCVNMTNNDAKLFYDFAPIGTPVHVRWA